MRKDRLRPVLTALALAASACGGKQDPPTPVLSIEVSPPSLEVTCDEGTSRQATAVVNATAEGEPVLVQAEADGAAFASVQTSEQDGRTAVTVWSSPSVLPGTYRGDITLVACADAECNRRLGTYPLPYTLTVLRPLATPNPVDLAAVSGATAEATVSVRLPPAASGFDVQVTQGAGWLAITSRTAVGFTVHAAARPRGTYLGALRLTAGDEVRVVQVRYAVAPRPLVVTPSPVALAAVSGSGASAEISVALPDDATDYTVEPVATGGWLSVADRGPAGFTLRASSLRAGTYHGSLSFTAGDSTPAVPVDYEVTAPPGGEHGTVASPTSLTLTAAEGATSEESRLDVTPPTWNPPVQARVEYPGAQGWLTVARRLGGYDVRVNAGALTQGSYTATIVVSGDASTIDVRVPVALTVGPGLVRPPDRAVTLTAESTPSDLLGSPVVALVGGPARAWTASSDAAWLVLDDAAGTTGEALVYHVDLAHVAAMAPDASDTATVTIAAQPSTITPTSFRVTVTKRLSEIARVTPYAQPAGQPNRFLVRGRRFDLLNDLAGSVIVDGIGPATATRRSDEELEIRVPAAPAGTYRIRIASGLGLTSGSGQVTLFEPGALPYARFLQSGLKRGLTYDPVRRAVFFVNHDQRAIFRYRYTGGGWEVTQRAIPALEDIGLTAEGDALLAVTGTTHLLVLDPDTLEDRVVLDHPGKFHSTESSAGVPVLNDGRAWLASGPIWDDSRSYPVTLETTDWTFAPGPTLEIFNGPWFSVSRDRERLLVCQTNSISPPPPIRYVDAIDNVVRESPTNETGFVLASMSDDGGRVMLDGGSVYDGSFAPVGQVSLPTPYVSNRFGYGYGTALSPDGSRAYVLAYSYYTGDPARLYVVDTSRAPATGPELPVLGSRDLLDLPPWDPNQYWTTPRALLAVSPDEQTLFLASSEALLVLPLPLVLDPP